MKTLTGLLDLKSSLLNAPRDIKEGFNAIIKFFDDLLIEELPEEIHGIKKSNGFSLVTDRSNLESKVSSLIKNHFKVEDAYVLEFDEFLNELFREHGVLWIEDEDLNLPIVVESERTFEGSNLQGILDSKDFSSLLVDKINLNSYDYYRVRTYGFYKRITNGEWTYRLDYITILLSTDISHKLINNLHND